LRANGVSWWYEYRLTERALDVYPVIVGLMRWADRHLATEADADALELIHRSCGKPAEPYLACSHCHQPLTGRDIDARVRSTGSSPGSGTRQRSLGTSGERPPGRMR
jgi:hypothetical protein